MCVYRTETQNTFRQKSLFVLQLSKYSNNNQIFRQIEARHWWFAVENVAFAAFERSETGPQRTSLHTRNDFANSETTLASLIVAKKCVVEIVFEKE